MTHTIRFNREWFTDQSHERSTYNLRLTGPQEVKSYRYVAVEKLFKHVQTRCEINEISRRQMTIYTH